uniref:Ubiquitin carboxyl-terminal hydrolase n=1 Tax=Bombyx mori TaxID=7091 RepID=A0A8R2C4X6_BOMMO|nr:ubiquitin carboxyl-terminal hydrolase 16 isoform X1 [Bombyx mori]XP_037874518.1 ubiquitin carboxyl-terminal hydrolase 16 isoform X1 [Bombyx mori]
MVKKKRQSDPGENGDESTESCEENVKSACPHVAKAVDLTRLKKAIKIGGFEKECSECKKVAKTEVLDPDFEEDLSLWMCLRCGTQLCGRTRNKHALNHFNTPHSDCHALAANSTTWEIYCYNCNNEVTASTAKKLHECIEYLKKQFLASSTVKSLPPIELPFETKDFSIIETISKDPLSKGKDKAMVNLGRVRGLSNLGNTCFFNSVMQCLVQTPYLLKVLQEMSVPGEKFKLPGGKLKLRGDAGELKDVDLPPIAGQLGEWGTLTRTLAETLEELQGGEGGVYTPRKLLSALVNKLPQFGGGDQHDAHELLRHLLEAVRSEDLRRYQSVILSSLGMNSKVDPAKVDGEVKQKVKFYGQQASDTMLRPEQVFRGFLVSTLECQDCLHQSDRAEYFLDLSLPVAACRPQPPAVARRKTPNEENAYNTQEENKPSKHQLKKERIAARKAARKNKGAAGEGGADTSGPAKEDGNSSSEQSDADVEDNLEEQPRPGPALAHTAANFAVYHMESGYNSEKVISADSIRTSPVHLDKEKADNTPERTDKDGPPVAIPLQYEPLENLSNPDSGVASPEATKHNSTETVHDEPSPVKPEYERPASRISFAPEYTNELVSRGISVQGCRNLLENSVDNSYDSLLETKTLNELNEQLDNLYLEEPPPPAPQPRPAPPSPRYVCDEDECSVHSCLAQFTALELLTGNNKVGCELCTERVNGKGGKTIYTNATKRFLVSSPPAVLILHLKRFQIGPRCMFRKMSKHVDFPTVLDLAPFCAMDKVRGQASLLYALYGVVEHSGGMHGGHYVAYVKLRRGARGSPCFLPRGGNAPPPPPSPPPAPTRTCPATSPARRRRPSPPPAAGTTCRTAWCRKSAKTRC